MQTSIDYTTQKRGDDSYLDLSYSQSPSLILKNQRQISVERQYIRDNNKDNGKTFADRPAPPTYNDQLLKQIENKTMKPLLNGYQGI